MLRVQHIRHMQVALCMPVTANVHVSRAELCGSGGCTLFTFAGDHHGSSQTTSAYKSLSVNVNSSSSGCFLQASGNQST